MSHGASRSGKGKGKAAPQIVLSDTEVSSEEDDIPLKRMMSQCGHHTVARPRGGDVDSARHVRRLRVHLDGKEVSAAAVTAEKASEMRTVEEAVVVKVPVDKAAVVKAATDKAMAAKAVEEAMAELVADEATVKNADQGAVGVKATVESMGSDPTPLLPWRWEPRERLC
jgi:hypothetical protein